MKIINELRRWSWDEVYIALSHERGRREALVLAKSEIGHPTWSGATFAHSAQQVWDYRFQNDRGQSLFVQDRGDSYAAFLEEDGPLGPLVDDTQPLSFIDQPAQMAVAGGMLMMVGGLWAVLELMLNTVA